MFSTSLVAAVVTGLAATGSTLVGQPTWQTDYRTALTESTKQQKPVAVFINRGSDGYAQLVAGGISADAAKVLKQSYVCVYVDVTTDAGKKLAGSFKLNEGLVISDKTGGMQALRHEGTVSAGDLKTYLVKYAEGTPVTQTEVRSAAAPVAAPVYVPYGGYQPAYGSSCPGGVCGPRPIFGGSCPGGNCRR
jgi:hypothetical protein